MYNRPVIIFHLSVGDWICYAILLSFAHCILAHFITDLAASTSPTKLSMWLETIVPVDTDHSTVKHSSVESVHSKCCLLPRSILDEAEAARLHFHTIEAHDKIYNLSTSRKEFEKLAFECEE